MGVYRALGLIIMLWALNNYFANTFIALDNAASAALSTVEIAADTSSTQIKLFVE